MTDEVKERRDLRLSPLFPMKRIHETRVILGGVGALGNEVLKNLVLLGVRHVLVCDFDRVEAHNLTRSPMFRSADQGRYKAEAAAERGCELNPGVKITPFCRSIGELGLGAFRRTDLVFSTFDGDVPRLLVNEACLRVGCPWVDGGLDGRNHEAGEVAVFDARDEQARCFTCGMDAERVEEMINQLRHPIGCGRFDESILQAGGIPTTPMMASVIAGIQVAAGLSIVTNSDSIDDGGGRYDWVRRSAEMWLAETLHLDLRAREISRVRNRRLPNCYHHDQICPERLDDEGIMRCHSWSIERTTPREILERAAKDLQTEDVMIRLPEHLVPVLQCRECKEMREVFRSHATLRMLPGGRRCSRCGSGEVFAQLEVPLLTGIDRRSPYLDRQLGEIGIRPLDILDVVSVDEIGMPTSRRRYELSGDAAMLGMA